MSGHAKRPFWMHDAYAVRRLAAALNEDIDTCLSRAHRAIAVDLGCGDRPYKEFFITHDCRYIGCDLPGTGAEITLQPGAPVALETGCADLVVSFQVLEHVWDLDWYLLEARRLLRPDGHLLISTHGTWPYHPHPEDFRRWTRSGLIRELECRGFRVTACRALVGPLAWSSMFRCIAVSSLLRRTPFLGPLLSGVVSALWYPWLPLADALTPRTWSDQNAAIYVVLACREESA